MRIFILIKFYKLRVKLFVWRHHNASISFRLLLQSTFKKQKDYQQIIKFYKQQSNRFFVNIVKNTMFGNFVES